MGDYLNNGLVQKLDFGSWTGLMDWTMELGFRLALNDGLLS